MRLGNRALADRLMGESGSAKGPEIGKRWPNLLKMKGFGDQQRDGIGQSRGSIAQTGNLTQDESWQAFYWL